MTASSNTLGVEMVWIVVKDMDAAIKYYTEVLGLKLVERSDQHNWAELKGPSGIHIGLGSGEECCSVPAGGNGVICISVKDIVKARAHLEQQGAQLMGEIMEVPGHVKLQTLRDPSGNVLQLAQKLS